MTPTHLDEDGLALLECEESVTEMVDMSFVGAQFVSGSVAAWVEAAGARTVAIPYNLPEPELREWMRHLTLGLEHLHLAGICHRRHAHARATRHTPRHTRHVLCTGKRLWSYDLWRKPGEGGAPKRYLAATPEALAEAYATMAAVKRNVYEVITP